MLKLVTAVLLLAVACNGFITGLGSFVNKNELIGTPIINELKDFVAEQLAATQNLLLDNIRVVNVQVQVVNGMNYKLDLVAEPVNGAPGQTTKCTVTVYVKFDSVKNILQSQCQTS